MPDSYTLAASYNDLYRNRENGKERPMPLVALLLLATGDRGAIAQARRAKVARRSYVETHEDPTTHCGSVWDYWCSVSLPATWGIPSIRDCAVSDSSRLVHKLERCSGTSA